MSSTACGQVDPNGVVQVRIGKRLLHAGVATALIAGAMVASAGPAQALPRTCTQYYEEYNRDLGLASMYWGYYTTRHEDTFYDSYQYWTGQADEISAMFAFC